MSRLSEECNRILTVASVIGTEFSLRHLERLADGQSEDKLLELLEVASAGYAIEEEMDRIGSYHLTHALLQQTLTSELSTTRRVRTQARIAKVLEDLSWRRSPPSVNRSNLTPRLSSTTLTA